MASTPSQNNALELIGTGEKTGTWGVITNDNLTIIDRATKGVGTITLTTTSYSLDTVDYTPSEGHYAVLVFAGTPGGTCTVTINPNDQQKVFIVRNTTPSSVVLTQGSGGNVTVATGKATLVYANGAGSTAAVVDITPLLEVLRPSNNLSDVANAATARTNLGLAIGTNVQAWDVNLDQLAALAVTDGNFIVGNGSAWVAENGSTARTSLGLGSIATQDASSVAITGGSISGITDLAVADGGTGASNAGAARTNLGLVIGTDVQAYDAGLQSIAGLTTSANQLIYTTGSDTYATATLTAFGRSLVDDADAAAARTTLGLVIGTDVLAYNAGLAAIGSLAVTDGNIVVGNGSTWVAESGATARASLGLTIGTDVLAFDSNLQSFVTTFTLPTSDGTSGQVLQTNGSATLSFSTLSLDALSDARAVGSSLGLGSGAAAVSPSGANDTAVGVGALENQSGVLGGNTAVGWYALNQGTPSSTVAVGYKAGETGGASRGVFLGWEAGAAATGIGNVAVGWQSFRDTLSSGDYNIAIGSRAGLDITTGSNNVLVGTETGWISGNPNNLTTGTNNILLGHTAMPSSATVSNEITIGNSSHKVLRLPWTSTVAGLPSASTVGAGARSFVTDANATTFASIVAGGGSNGVPVYSDGTNWRIG